MGREGGSVSDVRGGGCGGGGGWEGRGGGEVGRVGVGEALMLSCRRRKNVMTAGGGSVMVVNHLEVKRGMTLTTVV